jgi:hypothetical protein
VHPRLRSLTLAPISSSLASLCHLRLEDAARIEHDRMWTRRKAARMNRAAPEEKRL